MLCLSPVLSLATMLYVQILSCLLLDRWVMNQKTDENGQSAQRAATRLNKTNANGEKKIPISLTTHAPQLDTTHFRKAPQIQKRQSKCFQMTFRHSRCYTSLLSSVNEHGWVFSLSLFSFPKVVNSYGLIWERSWRCPAKFHNFISFIDHILLGVQASSWCSTAASDAASGHWGKNGKQRSTRCCLQFNDTVGTG